MLGLLRKEVDVYRVGEHEVVRKHKMNGDRGWECRRCDVFKQYGKGAAMEWFQGHDCHDCNCEFCSR